MMQYILQAKEYLLNGKCVDWSRDQHEQGERKMEQIHFWSIVALYD